MFAFDFSSLMKEKCILPMMKIMNAQEEILLWSKNVKGCPIANTSQCWRLLIKFQELLIQRLDRFLFRITENDIGDEHFLATLWNRNHMWIWKKEAETGSLLGLSAWHDNVLLKIPLWNQEGKVFATNLYIKTVLEDMTLWNAKPVTSQFYHNKWVAK